MTRAALLRWAPLAVFIAVPAILILPILWTGKMLFGQDVLSVFHCQRVVIAQAFREGRLPVWDPHVMAGFPLLAAIQGAVFYPPTWLCVLLPAGTFWTLSALVHLSLAGCFAHRWLERGLGLNSGSALAGGFVFMMSGYLAGHLYAGHVNYVWAYPWIPALMWRLERFLAGATLKRGVLLAAFLALLFLAGVPQYVFFAGLLVLARGIHFVLAEREERKKRGKQVGLAVAWLALGMVFCAPQLFPTLELTTQMQRGLGEDQAFLLQHTMPPRALVKLVIPSEIRADSYAWESTAYVGGGAFLLLLAAFAGKHSQRYLWLGIAALSLLLAMGSHGLVYEGFIAIVPGAGLFRGPGRYLLLVTVSAAALTGFGFDALWSRDRLTFRIPAVLLAVLAGVQLLVFSRDLIGPVDPIKHEMPLENREPLRRGLGLEGRLANQGSVDWIGKCQAAGLDQVCGYEPMMLSRYTELMNAAQGLPIETPFVILATVGRHPVIDMLGVRGWWPPSDMMRKAPDYLPRAWVVNNAVVIESKEERLKVLGKGPFDPRKTVILEEYPAEAPPVPTDEEAGRARVISRGPGQYVLEAQALSDAYLVLSEAYYPGWTAEVDGKPVPVLPANHLLQAVRLPPGKHVVTFAYRSRFLGWGFAVAVLAMLSPAGIALVRRRRR